jgi:cytochrome c553
LAIDRDPKSGFVAYVPRGSIARGKILVTNGAGRTLACAACHGASLKGSGNVPRLAGISPLYIARQLVAFRNDDRGGAASQPMKSVVAALTTDDVLAISAYLSSLKP